ncbi:MAG: hypothetical protein QG567_2184, partial [Campylobacterota bacterium]|nr:hypothetical protein [Campylobacterota bacterium]
MNYSTQSIEQGSNLVFKEIF